MKLKLTNKLGLPLPIVKAISNDPYDPGAQSDYTATGLLKPARMAQLLKQDVEVEEDAADRMHSLFGQVVHGVLERAAEELIGEGYLVEDRFSSNFEVDGKVYVISAQVDLFNPATGVLSDYKCTSVAASQYGLKAEHKYQINLQAELLRRHNYNVAHGEAVLLLKDWSKERTHEGYPTLPTTIQQVPLMPPNEIVAWVEERIRAHVAAETSLPDCTDEERWARPSFALMKDLSAKRATRVFDTKEEAEAFLLTEKGKGLTLVERAGESVRCLRYCPARTFCKQGLALTNKGLEGGASVVEVDGSKMHKLT